MRSILNNLLKYTKTFFKTLNRLFKAFALTCKQSLLVQSLACSNFSMFAVSCGRIWTKLGGNESDQSLGLVQTAQDLQKRAENEWKMHLKCCFANTLNNKCKA